MNKVSLIIFCIAIACISFFLPPESSFASSKIDSQQILLAQAPDPGVRAPIEKKGDVSFNFDDADLFSVIQTVFGEILKVNYIVDPRVTGKVTFRTIAPVLKEDVLPLMQVILRLNGVGVVEEAGLYRIIPIADMSREPAPVSIGREAAKVKITGKALLQVVPIKYIPSAEMIRILTPFLSANAMIVDVPKGNYIVISDTDANIKRLLQIIEVFDSERIKAAIPQVFVYPVQNSKAKDLASLLQQIFLDIKPSVATPATTTKAATPATPSPAPQAQPQISMGLKGVEVLVSEVTRIFADEVTNSLIILATPDDYATIVETIKKIDIVPRQVMIEALIAEITLKDELSLGLAWYLKNINIRAFKSTLTGIIGFNKGSFVDKDGKLITDNALIEGLSTSGFSFVATGNNFSGLLNALATDNKLKVLASPHILALDNREAKILIGDQVPIVTSITTPGAGQTGATSSTVQYKDTGVILTVKPQINEGGLVYLDVSQEVSSAGKITLRAGEENIAQEQVTINKREVKTNLVVQDGNTIVIGGLIQDKATDNRSGIPLLSKIPVLGHLFGTTTKTNDRTELIIMLTPRVIKSQTEAIDVSSDYMNRLKGIGKGMEIDIGKDGLMKEEKNTMPKEDGK